MERDKHIPRLPGQSVRRNRGSQVQWQILILKIKKRIDRWRHQITTSDLFAVQTHPWVPGNMSTLEHIHKEGWESLHQWTSALYFCKVGRSLPFTLDLKTVFRAQLMPISVVWPCGSEHQVLREKWCGSGPQVTNKSH